MIYKFLAGGMINDLCSYRVGRSGTDQLKAPMTRFELAIFSVTGRRELQASPHGYKQDTTFDYCSTRLSYRGFG
jgi:hypothetical protein